MEYKSEIRDSQKQDLLDKVARNSYGKYLAQIDVKHARGLVDQTIKFDFPVTALIGPNGGGKTTVLGAAACGYKVMKPGLFFPKSGTFDQGMQNWAFEYDFVDKTLRPTGYVRRTAKFRSLKWNRDSLERNVYYFGVSRTVPASERPEMRRCVSGRFTVPQGNITLISQNVSDAVSRILGKKVAGFSHVRVDISGRITLLTGMSGASAYSEFHFGAGESSVIRMSMALETCPENSLVLIEEIENGLHPLATLRMVEYLIGLAERKKLQVIFTTHSDEALLPLPDKAVWSVLEGKAQQGALSVKSMRAITGNAGCRLVIYVEDDFAKNWVQSILKDNASDVASLVEIYPMGGDTTARDIHCSHMKDPAKVQDSICILDGDSDITEDVGAGVFKLPGGAPERYVYDAVMGKLDNELGRLTVALHQKFEASAHVKACVLAAVRDAMDHHNLYSNLGEKLGFTSVSVVSNAFLTIWTHSNPELSKEIFERIKPKMSALFPL